MTRRILDYPLLLLFVAAWWSLLPGPSAYCLQASPTCKLVAYNLNNYSIQGSENLPAKSLTSLSAIKDILSSLQPDILVLTEMGSQQDLLFLQKKLRDTGLFLPYTVWVNSIDPLRHLALLSRFPITQDNSLRLVPTPIPNHFVKRGIMDVTFRLESSYALRVVGAHLKSQRAPIRQSHRTRFAEAQALASHVTNILQRSPDTNLLVVGDFNDYPTSLTLKTVLLKKTIPSKATVLPGLLRATPLFDLVPSDKCGERWTHYFEKEDIYSRLDYLLAAQGIIPEIIEAGICRHPRWCLASDHRPLYVVISIPSLGGVAEPYTQPPDKALF
ncbi:Endonuclease/Exonuclease/phosphatase family protein [Candidatus Xiphinematobacter sp. Idaho Grape]|uniref:endonuclease/exonuclease/phosphatase family protein n=1 Tax=Candidatus Xiphinematobacter sp. Idaho Grape TaxID=1704307 RepID=UPI000705A1EC|nr:endonuclease/exonuclease/phosphatase family protein [Candidatus Xiphinematobacter sp. Idaho Grape]ALJ57016.1 Endonuclease/Exonuclease/phosphatase family protein [Candidatus Xiphinematobacter sp. Idaho Grape]